MGLLEGTELAAAEARMTDDADFARAVSTWRERLADLDATAEALAPSAALWDRIADSTKVKPAIPLPGARAALRGATLWDNIGFWRGTGIGGVFAALMLVVILIGALATSRQLRRELIALAQRKPIYVAVLVNDATRETGAIVNTFSDGRVELIPLRPIDVPAGRTLRGLDPVGSRHRPEVHRSHRTVADIAARSGSIAGYGGRSVVRDHAGARRRLADRKTDGADFVQGNAARAL